MKILIYFILFTLALSSRLSVSSECADTCTFVLTSQSGEEIVINKARASERMTPFSTFKIANTLIALETNEVSDLNQLLTYDHSKYPTQSCWPEIWSHKPLTIREAFQYSAVPIYKEIASNIGEQTMQTFLNQFDYGNKDISSGIDNFWLNKSLKINALEQAEFLKKIFESKLGLSRQTFNSFKRVMLVEETDKYTLYAKTGGGDLINNRALGWYIGVIVHAKGNYYFALNIEGRSFANVQEDRIKIARDLLKSFNVI